MRTLLTGAAVLAVFAISVPLASATGLSTDGGPADAVTICHTTGSLVNPDVSITVSGNALLAHRELHLDEASTCVGLEPGPPVGLEPGPPSEVGPPTKGIVSSLS